MSYTSLISCAHLLETHVISFVHQILTLRVASQLVLKAREKAYQRSQRRHGVRNESKVVGGDESSDEEKGVA